MRDQPISTGACCPKDVSGVTQLKLGDEGHGVGISGLEAVFEQLLAMGREPDEVSDTELVDMGRAARNYIPSRQETEAKYATALRRAYVAFYARRLQKRQLVEVRDSLEKGVLSACCEDKAAQESGFFKRVIHFTRSTNGRWRR